MRVLKVCFDFDAHDDVPFADEPTSEYVLSEATRAPPPVDADRPMASGAPTSAPIATDTTTTLIKSYIRDENYDCGGVASAFSVDLDCKTSV
jgi:hypothetical protein